MKNERLDPFRLRMIGTKDDIVHEVQSTGGYNVKVTTQDKNIMSVTYSGGATEDQMHDLLHQRRPVGMRFELHRRSDFNLLSFVWGTLVGFVIAIIVGVVL